MQTAEWPANNRYIQRQNVWHEMSETNERAAGSVCFYGFEACPDRYVE